MPAVAPEIVNDNEGNPIFNLTPSRFGGGVTQDLEIAFTIAQLSDLRSSISRYVH